MVVLWVALIIAQTEAKAFAKYEPLYCIPVEAFDTLIYGCKNPHIILFIEKLVRNKNAYCITDRQLNRLIDICLDIERL